ncbi:hypothetical protein PIB19_06020 [Sphingomonas sp. 7/4-4]|uniref:RHS repeat domain-containing protein n=1 Tax=Sphingomonas sp. 7/4-4 TaxID=3018446 RepID=UPI0022F3EFAF|nr:RHS repeat protein [Sphingomonas sp. 7/4-4]WBY08952.1 hypothetical protein PIB19_06020 [Sphingomonas sp. 7/4-4]
MLKNGATTVGTVTYGTPSGGVYTVTTPGGKTWRITGSEAITALRKPGATSDTLTVSRDANGKANSVTRDGITTAYNYSVSGNTATMVVTDAQSHATTIVSDIAKFRPTAITDALGKTTSFSYDSLGRPTEVTYPEGDKIQYGYDGRGNLTETRRKAKPASGLPDITTTASYPASCTTPSCNEPDTTTDERGGVTNYGYDGNTGLITSVTSPAPTPGANRPQTRYSYTATGVSLLTGVSQCQTGVAPGCVGTTDEVKVAVGYDANLNVTSTTIAAGDNSLAATTTQSWDPAGNLLTVDGPLPGSEDTVTYRYDADRQRVGAISPDPDGAGSAKRRAARTTYNSIGQPTVAELGNVNGTSDSDWATFASAQQETSAYDANGFKTSDTVTGSGGTYQVTQYSYDAVGRLDCTALRMNTATWGSLPGACSPATAGAAGPDRITRNTYDPVGRITTVQTAYGTADQSDEVTAGYTSNGQLASVTDAEGNKTSYEYDGFDRPSITRYPVTTVAAGASSTTDYEQLGYDAASNVTSRRLRDGQSIGYSYDNLNRLTFTDLPNGAVDEQDITYGYDLLGRLKSASKNPLNQTLFSYDALGRKTTESNYYYSLGSTYDLAGRRTRMTWNDGFYVTYDHYVTGEVTEIRENSTTPGVLVLADYSYDDLGRRTGITRGNGTTTNYSYDAVSRLASLTQDLGAAPMILPMASRIIRRGRSRA